MPLDARPSLQAARRRGGQLSVAALHELPRQDVNLSRDQRARGQGGRGAAEARGQEGHQGRALSCPIARPSSSITSRCSKPAAWSSTTTRSTRSRSSPSRSRTARPSSWSRSISSSCSTRSRRCVKSGALSRRSRRSFAGLLPSTKSVLFKLFKAKELARPLASPIADKIVLEAALMANDGRYVPAVIDPSSEIAVLQYTGGTTGTPKGAMLTHANVYLNVRQVVAWCPDLGVRRPRRSSACCRSSTCSP